MRAEADRIAAAELFKATSASLGVELGLPSEMVYRHPFPDRGWECVFWARCMGTMPSRCAEPITFSSRELRRHDLYDRVSQAFAVFLPVKSVGGDGDGRRYDYVIALRAVETVDFMTVRWAHLPYEFFGFGVAAHHQRSVVFAGGYDGPASRQPP